MKLQLLPIITVLVVYYNYLVAAQPSFLTPVPCLICGEGCQCDVETATPQAKLPQITALAE
ncbi:hypothetical protein GALMADRAFT_255827 [Galerina marginata CBS 339.88]|uniref:Uncharacterized protein n=1 Tax=Galerina marginata (strain CBS 339.88) TaxID=685588 RepID=A0A067SHY8_GALM3|nr:hypothetical protein GALMADRAFT_255827 [Galerina marginata CBS 339.88]